MLTPGVDYPRDYGQLRAWFSTDERCLDYLDWLRWPDGFVCPHCGSGKAWAMADGTIRRCAGCRRRVSVTSGTIFADTRTPLTVWFAAAWRVTSAKNGISAQELQQVLGVGTYQTAWTMLHRFRVAMAASGRDLLTGRVEVDETFVGGREEGADHGGRGMAGKTIVGVAVELDEDHKRLGRVRLGVLPNASSVVLHDFVAATIAPGSVVATDGWPAYVGALAGTWVHEPTSIRASGVHAHELLPGVHRVASLLKRWLLGTHQGGGQPTHLPAYLDEFTFRFNRRRSRARGLLFYQLLVNAVTVEPVTYKSLVATPPAPKPVHPAGVRGPHARPLSLQLPPPDRPWRHDQH